MKPRSTTGVTAETHIPHRHKMQYEPCNVQHTLRSTLTSHLPLPASLSFAPSVVPVAEASVIIAVSSPHRREALAAVEYGIDTLKATVPIWKKVGALRHVDWLHTHHHFFSSRPRLRLALTQHTAARLCPILL